MTAFLDEVRNQHRRAFHLVRVLGRCSNTATVMKRMGSFLIESWDSNLGLITICFEFSQLFFVLKQIFLLLLLLKIKSHEKTLNSISFLQSIL